MSPMAPAGSAKTKNGSADAVWVSATYIGPAPSDTMSHAAPTVCMNVPTSDMTSAIRRLRKSGVRNGFHRLGGTARTGADSAESALDVARVPMESIVRLGDGGISIELGTSIRRRWVVRSRPTILLLEAQGGAREHEHQRGLRCIVNDAEDPLP